MEEEDDEIKIRLKHLQIIIFGLVISFLPPTLVSLVKVISEYSCVRKLQINWRQSLRRIKGSFPQFKRIYWPYRLIAMISLGLFGVLMILSSFQTSTQETGLVLLTITFYYKIYFPIHRCICLWSESKYGRIFRTNTWSTRFCTQRRKEFNKTLLQT